MGALEHVQSGKPWRPSAKAHNAFVDTSLWVQRQQQAVGSGQVSDRSESGIVLVRNDSGADRARGEVLGIDGAVFSAAGALDTFKNQIVLKGIKPKYDTYTKQHDGRICVLLEPVASTAIGLACLDGVCAVQVDLVATWHFRADMIHDDPGKLRSYAGGCASILAIDRSATGTKWAIVRLGVNPMTKFEGKLDGELGVFSESSDVSATMSIWRKKAAGAAGWEDTGDNETVYAPRILKDQPIAAGKNVTAYWQSQAFKLYVDGRECPP